MQGYTQTDTTGPDGAWSKDETCPRSKVWVIFENGRAYPKYLIRYYRGDRDATRTQFETREDAGVTGSMARRHIDRQQDELTVNPVHPRRPRPPPALPGPRAAARAPAPAALWVVASQGLVPGAGTMEINGVQTPNVIGMADASRVEEAWQRGRASAEYTGENGQRYVLTFADMVQRNKDTGNPSRAHRLVNGSDSTWYAKVLGPREPPGPNGERQFYGTPRRPPHSRRRRLRLTPSAPAHAVAVAPQWSRERAGPSGPRTGCAPRRR